jgi:hypothetical protein
VWFVAALLGGVACGPGARAPTLPYLSPRPVEHVRERWDGSYLIRHPGHRYTVVAPVVYDGPDRPGAGVVWTTERCSRIAEGIPYLFPGHEAESDEGGGDWGHRLTGGESELEEAWLTVDVAVLPGLALCERAHGPGYRIASLEEYLAYAPELHLAGRWFLAAPDGSVVVLQHWSEACPLCRDCSCRPDYFEAIAAPAATLLCMKSTDHPEPAPPHRVEEIDECVHRYAAADSPWTEAQSTSSRHVAALDVSALEVVLPVERACATADDAATWDTAIDAFERRFQTAKQIAADLSAWRSALPHLLLLEMVGTRAQECSPAASPSVNRRLDQLGERFNTFFDSPLDPDAAGVYERPMTWRDAAYRCASCFP